MATNPPIAGETFVAMMRDALKERVRASLKEPLMKQAEAMVDEAVDMSVEALKPRIEAWIDEYHQSLDLRILVERVGESPPSLSMDRNAA